VIVDAQGASFYLIGEINNTGEFPLTKDMSLLQALAMAGGFTEWADKDNILVLRRHNGQEERIEIDYTEIVSGKKPEKNIIIQPGDTIVVK
jgi:polysaccharide export outer membrane protein